jgi:hypothetical protein
MKGGARTALAIGVGYTLGRRRKMRMATVLAMAAATGGIGGFGPAALKRGVKLLNSTDLAGSLSPQVTEIVDTLRGDLLDAGKAAATAAVSNRIESFSDNLHSRAETLRNPTAAAADAGEAVSDVGKGTGKRVKSTAGGTAGRLRRRGRPADEDRADEDRADEDRADEDRAEEEPADEYEGDEDEPEEEESAPPPRRRRASPVARTRR